MCRVYIAILFYYCHQFIQYLIEIYAAHIRLFVLPGNYRTQPLFRLLYVCSSSSYSTILDHSRSSAAFSGHSMCPVVMLIGGCLPADLSYFYILQEYAAAFRFLIFISSGSQCYWTLISLWTGFSSDRSLRTTLCWPDRFAQGFVLSIPSVCSDFDY